MEGSSIISPGKRRSSVGRSSLIEQSKNLLEYFFSQDYNDEDFSANVINNNIPGEFRSILWRVYLGILPNPHCKKDWIKETKKYRKNFESLTSEENFQNALNFYNSKLNSEVENKNYIFNLNFKFDSEFSLIKEELESYSKEYDMFKSEFLKKSFLTIYLVWRIKNNLELNENAVIFISRILGILIYSLYPSIIHLNENIDEIDATEEDMKKIFYFFNLEDYFDHDIYEIYEKLLKTSEMQNYIINFSNNCLENKLNEEIKISRNEESYLVELLDKKLCLDSDINKFSGNFIENLSFNFFFIFNKDLLQKLILKGFDIYNLVANYYLSLFFNSTKFENITYYIDNILIYSRAEDLRFLGYLILSSLLNLEEEFAELPKDEIDKFFKNFPVSRKDPKDIVGKALKIREKINKKFYKQ